MNLQTILIVLILLVTIRKRLKAEGRLEGWDKILTAAIYTCIGVLTLYFFGSISRQLATFLSYGGAALLIYYIYKEKALAFAKPYMIAVLPLIALSFVQDVVKAINRNLYKDWDIYLETASLFAFIWMIVMLINHNRQRKVQEKERRIHEEKERDYKITEQLKAQLEVQVRERTAEITQQKEELQKTLHELEATQTQLIHSEKMASLGELTAGIAHEIQNPLNFVNNFSEINKELIIELQEEVEKGNFEEVKALALDILSNEEKINHHGKRADSIVKGMLQHSRTSTGQKELTDINALCDECLRLSYHGLRAKDKSFNAAFNTSFDESLEKINVLPQEMGRVILNLCNNAFYAINERKKTAPADYKPTLTIVTRLVPAGTYKKGIEIQVNDNGSGIPPSVVEKIFQPFFTTKPTGQGTGLGLSMSYEIITNAHNGTLTVQSQENVGTSFIIYLPY